MPKPNLILLVTDQQRAPQHWPADPAWLDELMPNDAELRRTGISFTRAFTATAMCSPSRASFLTGTYPSRHGVTLTLTEGDLFPDRAQRPGRAAHGRAAGAQRRGPARGGWRARFVRGLLRLGPKSGNEPELPPGIDTLATLLRERGYHVALKGKWHLSKPVNGREWSAADPERIERDYGFADWEPPDAGGDAKAETFGGGNAGTTHEGWDEDYTRQMEAWLGRRRICRSRSAWSFSLVNPHDVLGYPSLVREGRLHGRGVRRPGRAAAADGRRGPARQADRALADEARPDRVHRRAARRRRRSRDYVNFYAYLHRVVDEKIGRLLAALGRPRRPGLAALAHGDRAHVRPRRARPVARRAAPEDVQRLRGVDPGAAGDLEPGAVPPAARERRAGLARRPRARRCSAWRATRATRSASTGSTWARS